METKSKKLVARIAEIIVFLASVATIVSLYLQKINNDSEIARSNTAVALQATDDTIKRATEISGRETEVAFLVEQRDSINTLAAQGGLQVDLLSTQNAAINQRLSTLAPELPTIQIINNTSTPTPSSTSVPIIDTPTLETPLPISTNFGNVTANYSVQDYQDNPTQTVLRNGQSTGVDILNVVDNKWIFSVGFGGTDLILCTHPLTPTIPSTFTITTSNDKLRFSVRPHNAGDSYIEFWVGDTLIHKEVISDKRWYTEELELPAGTETVLLKHYATGWRYEYLYWAILE